MEGARLSGTATALSGAPKHPRGSGGLFRLARASLALFFALTGCIVKDPPEFNAPVRTPPRLDLSQTLTRIDQIVQASTDPNQPENVVPFSIPVSSEDAGEQLSSYLFLDFDPTVSSHAQIAGADVPASTLDDLDRKFEFSWTVGPDVSKGCHQLKLLVTHELARHDDKPVDPNDLAEVVWWANVNVDPANPNTLVDCPNLGSGTP